MARPGEPPEGPLEGVPGGGDDEYRSVVFDESFVRAARIQEYSARERLDGTSRTVRTRRGWARSGAPRQAMVLVVLIVLAFGTAIYMGIRHPYQDPETPVAQPLRITLIPLTPDRAVAAAEQDALYRNHRAAQYRAGAEGITMPAVHRVGDFSESQVLRALSTAKDYLVASSVDPGALTAGDVRTVRNMLAPGQLEQFDRSLEESADDGQHAATGWLVRFDPARVRLADDRVRVDGTMTVKDAGDGALEILTDHTMVYAVRGTADASTAPSLFTVRRELRLRLDRDDLQDRHVEVVQAAVEAGPLSCTPVPVAYFRPLLAGQSPQRPAGVDPYDHEHPVTSLCGVLGGS